MQGLRINTARHNEPDTRFTKAELDALETEMRKATRDEFKTLLSRLRRSLRNTYFDRELNFLDGCLDDSNYKFSEIRSDALGVLLKLTPSQRGGMAKSGTFHFKSHQVHHLVQDGKRKTRKNIVTVHGNKGTKRVVTYNSERARKRFTRSKALTAKEIKNIKAGKFMPGLFKGMQ